MNSRSTSNEELLASLSNYAYLLQERKDALVHLSRTSEEVRSILVRDPTADIGPILSRREQDCRSLESVFGGSRSDTLVIGAAQRASASPDARMSNLAHLILALHAELQTLAEKVLACQNECETILKQRLEATARALRDSTQRRRLDATYGPACRHETPTFLDKQR